MRNDYKIDGKTTKIEIEIEKEVAEKLDLMEKHTKLSRSELANTALKRFISSHKDFMPVEEKRT
jgi:metal-responsive CopG/Arc/MetJ family transcriptional regulator